MTPSESNVYRKRFFYKHLTSAEVGYMIFELKDKRKDI